MASAQSANPGLAAPTLAILAPLPGRVSPQPLAARSPWPLPAHTQPPSALRIALRMARWGGAATGAAARLAQDRLRAPLTLARVALHLRRALESMGATAVKLGQQVAIRVDLLPFELCQELSKLNDRASPMPSAAAIAEIERSLGQPLSTVFSVLDPNPVGSASIACVYKGRLHSGEWVAVKVQRPGVASAFSADLTVFDALTRALELVSVVRPGFFKALRSELRSMFEEELNFEREARYQALFRRQARKDRVDWLTCPKVYRRWSSRTVMVSEFIEGLSCSELIAAAETRDTRALSAFAQQDIHPGTVARRMMYLSNWGRFEALFFHADPHPANVMVLPGSRVCMLDFGACGVMSWSVSHVQLEVIGAMLDDDVTRVTELALASLAPLPAVNMPALRRSAEEVFSKFQFGLRDPNAPWNEHTTSGLWLALVELSQRFNLQMNLDTLRLMRATLLYDTVALRLDADLSVDIQENYQRQAARRQARRQRRDRRRSSGGLPAGAREALRQEERRRELRELGGELLQQQERLKLEARRLGGAAVGLGGWLVWAAPLSLLASLTWLLLPPPSRAAALQSLSSPAGALLCLQIVVLGLLRLRHRLRERGR